MTTSIPANPDTDLIAQLAKEIFADSPAAGSPPAATGPGISDYPTDAQEIAPPVHPAAPVSSSQTIQPVESVSGGHAATSEEAYPFGEPRCYRNDDARSIRPASGPVSSATALPYTDASFPGQDFYFLRGSEVPGISSLPGPSSAGHGSALPAFNVDAVRRDFPALHQKMNGRPLIFLDNAATTQKPQSVIDATSNFYSRDNANIHRAAYELAERATRAYEGAREKVREFIGGGRRKGNRFSARHDGGDQPSSRKVTAAKISGRGDEIILSTIEHHANIVPWQLLAEQTGAVIRVAPVNDRGELILDQFALLLSGRTKLVSITHVANSLGTIHPVEQIIAISHAYGVPVLVDAAQSAPHMPLNVTALDVDFLAFSGHKVFGPTGIGALYGKSALLEAMPPRGRVAGT